MERESRSERKDRKRESCRVYRECELSWLCALSMCVCGATCPVWRNSSKLDCRKTFSCFFFFFFWVGGGGVATLGYLMV
jgi:hypothetical protein